MNLTEFSQAVLIYYSANMLLALVLFRPGTKSFEQLMKHPVAQSRPAIILMLMMHFLIPSTLIAILHPKRIAFYLRRLLLPLRIWLARRRLEARIAGWPEAMRPGLRAQIAKIPPQNLPHIQIKTPAEALRDEQEAARKKKDAENDR